MTELLKSTAYAVLILAAGFLVVLVSMMTKYGYSVLAGTAVLLATTFAVHTVRTDKSDCDW